MKVGDRLTCISYFVKGPRLQGVWDWLVLCQHHIVSRLVWFAFAWNVLQTPLIPYGERKKKSNRRISNAFTHTTTLSKPNSFDLVALIIMSTWLFNFEEKSTQHGLIRDHMLKFLKDKRSPRPFSLILRFNPQMYYFQLFLWFMPWEMVNFK